MRRRRAGTRHCAPYQGWTSELRPEQSPYALIAPQSLQNSPMSEGRSAYGSRGPGSWSGYGVQPNYFVTPKDRDDYLNGR